MIQNINNMWCLKRCQGWSCNLQCSEGLKRRTVTVKVMLCSDVIPVVINSVDVN